MKIARINQSKELLIKGELIESNIDRTRLHANGNIETFEYIEGNIAGINNNNLLGLELIELAQFGVFDSFDRANNVASLGTADTGQLWMPRIGAWGIRNNKAYQPNGAIHAIATVDSEVGNVLVSADILIHATVQRGICLRFKDVNNYIIVFLKHGTYSVYVKANGAFRMTITNNDIQTTVGEYFNFQLGIRDNLIDYYRLDGKTYWGTLAIQPAEYTALPNTITNHGLYAFGYVDEDTWDNFKVEEI